MKKIIITLILLIFSLNVEANLLEYDPNRPFYDSLMKSFNTIENKFSINIDDYVLYINNKILNESIYDSIKNKSKNYSNFSIFLNYYKVNNNRNNLDFNSDNYTITFNLNRKLFLSLSNSKINYDRILNISFRDMLILSKIRFYESDVEGSQNIYHDDNKINNYNITLSIYDRDNLIRNLYFNKFFSYSYNNNDLKYVRAIPIQDIKYLYDIKKKYIKHNFFGKLDIDYVINIGKDYNFVVNGGFEYNTINKNNNNTFLFISSLHFKKQFLNSLKYDIFLTLNKNMNKNYLIINNKKELLEKDNIETGLNLNYTLENKINFNFKTSYRSDKIRTLGSSINFDLYF